LAKDSNVGLLSGHTVLEIVRIKGEEVVVKEMTVAEWSGFKKQGGYRYVAYQKGFSQFKNTKQ
jgi:hypothetical protein